MASTSITASGVLFPDGSSQTTARTTSNTVTSVNGAVGAVTVAASGAQCTYTGSIVESAVIYNNTVGTIDMPAGYVMMGVRRAYDSCAGAYFYNRGTRLKNN